QGKLTQHRNQPRCVLTRFCVRVTPPAQIYTLSLHDALPIYVYYPDMAEVPESQAVNIRNRSYAIGALVEIPVPGAEGVLFAHGSDRKSTRLNSSHDQISYAVFCLKKKITTLAVDHRSRTLAL